ncbi:MAG: exosortase E/protease, VPEID-CTERM system [Burkholderiales bacterium]|nr:exosortase E/protease, VPEID-CTERM system [Burkholderiales bacterium]
MTTQNGQVGTPLQHWTPWHFQLRLPLFALLILMQASFVALFVHPRSAQYDGSLAYAPHLGASMQYLIYFCVALALALTARLNNIWHSLSEVHATRPAMRYLTAQLLCFFALLLVIGAVLPNDLLHFPLATPDREAFWSGALLLALAATAGATLFMIAPLTWWRQFAASEKIPLLLALGVTLVIYFINGIFQNTWDDFLSTPTIAVARFFLELFHADVVANAVTKELGIGNFIVLISSTCSGYEGMAMITAFLAWYSLTFRQDLKYPNALLLYPAALLLMWIFNCIRIASLVGIGHAISPEIAIQGFHSHAGWIYFLCVSIGMILVARRIPFFSGKSGGAMLEIDSLNVLLLPELVLLCATLITLAFTASFDWLYPVRIAVAGLTLGVFWKRFNLGSLTVAVAPVMIGIAVFLLWISIVPASGETTEAFATDLKNNSPLLIAGWLAIRALGATLIVPLAEELAFRGYLINVLSKNEATSGTEKFHKAWLPLIISSVAFGALHSAWLAGALAGLAFGVARFIRGKVWDAVIAHMVTNGLLAIYVLSTQQWSYW